MSAILDMLMGVELVVNPTLAAKGKPVVHPFTGVLLFHDRADVEVWIDGLREAGVLDEPTEKKLVEQS